MTSLAFRKQGIMRTLKPIMAELHVRANDGTTTPWPEQNEVSRECSEASGLAGHPVHPSFELKLNARDELMLLVEDNWPIILGPKDVVREQLPQFVEALSNP